MNYCRLDYTIEKVLKDSLTREQKILRGLVGKDFEKEEAKMLWNKIIDHKWYVGEQLKRDIGLRAAAVDYVENFYEPVFFGARKNDLKNSFREFFKIIVQTEFLRPKSL